ncbi:hypothetical protein HK102_012315, partial [Quaeritorhiza haematococci]
RRPQADPALDLGRRGPRQRLPPAGRSVLRGDAGRRDDPRRARRPGPQRRPARGLPLLRDDADRRREPVGPPEVGTHGARRGRLPAGADRPRRGTCAREGGGPPRHQAEQHHHRLGGQAVPDGLRPGEDVRAVDVADADVQGRPDGDAAVHIARAGPRRLPRGPAQRRLQFGRDALRDAHRPAAVHRRRLHGRGPSRPQRPAHAPTAVEPGRARRARSDLRPLPGQGSGEAFQVGRGAGRRTRPVRQGRADRDPAADLPGDGRRLGAGAAVDRGAPAGGRRLGDPGPGLHDDPADEGPGGARQAGIPGLSEPAGAGLGGARRRPGLRREGPAAGMPHRLPRLGVAVPGPASSSQAAGAGGLSGDDLRPGVPSRRGPSRGRRPSR